MNRTRATHTAPAHRRRTGGRITGKLRRWVTIAALFALGACVESPAGSRLDLRGDDWRIRFEDSARFRSPAYDDQRWEKIRVPSNWALRNSYAGVAWYRKTIVLDAAFLSANRGPVALYIETMLDSDEAYWNGSLIGGMGEIDDFRSHAYGRPRVYSIPREILRPGENVLAVRVRGFFSQDAGIRSGEVYLDHPLAIEARIVLAEQLQLLIAFAFLALAIIFLASCVYERSWQSRGWFAAGSWAAGWIQFWTTPLAYDWLETLDGGPLFGLLLAPGDPFIFVKMMDYGGYYLLGIAGIAFWTSYLRLRNTPMHVIYYSFSLLMYSGCVISDDLLLWNLLFDYWFSVTAMAMLWIIGYLVARSRGGDPRWRWLLLSFSVMAAAAVHDWFFHNGFAIASYSIPLLRFGLLVHQAMVGAQLLRDFRRYGERSDAEFQRLWTLRLKNQHFLRRLLAGLAEPVAEIEAASRELVDPGLAVPHGSTAGHRGATLRLGRLSRDSLELLSRLEAEADSESSASSPAAEKTKTA